MQYVDLWTWFDNYVIKYRTHPDPRRYRLAVLNWDMWDVRERDPLEAARLCEEGIELARELNEPCWEIYHEHWLCEMFTFYKADYEKALARSVRLVAKLNQPRYANCPVLSRCYRVLLDAYYVVDPYGYMDKIREMADFIESSVPMDSDTHPILLDRRANLYCYAEQYDDAKSVMQRYMSMTADSDFRQVYGFSLLAWIAYAEGDFTQALAFCSQSREANRRVNILSELRSIRLLQAVVCIHMGEFDEAEQHFRIGESMRKTLGVTLGYRFTSEYYAALGDYDTALRAWEVQLDELLTIGSPYRVVYYHLTRCRFLGQSGKITTNDVTQLTDAVAKTVNPAAYAHFVSRIENHDYSEFEWQRR